MMLCALFCLCLQVLATQGSNKRPIIGILAQSSAHEAWSKFGDTYIRASYVKFVEMGGARAVPIRIGESDQYYEDMFSKLNGVLFPGGSVGITTSGYAKAGMKLYDMAMKASVNGEYFPLWGTCQGFQLLSAMTSGEDLLVSCDAEDISLALNFTSAYKKSRLFHSLPNDLYIDASKYSLTQNYHHYCLKPKTVQQNKKLNAFYDILSTNLDRKGLQFVSTMEAYNYPFYGVQYHPEKSVFDWDINLAVDHDEKAVKFTQYLANFFIEEARKSTHKFPSLDAEGKALFDNYQPVYMGVPSFFSVYVFNLTNPHKKHLLKPMPVNKLNDLINSDESDDLIDEDDMNTNTNHFFYYGNGRYMVQMIVIIGLVAILALLILLTITRLRPATVKYKLVETFPVDDKEKLLIA